MIFFIVHAVAFRQPIIITCAAERHPKALGTWYSFYAHADYVGRLQPYHDRILVQNFTLS